LLVAVEQAVLPVQAKETLVEQVAVILLKTVQPHMMVNQNVVVVEELKAERQFQLVVTLPTLHSSTVELLLHTEAVEAVAGGADQQELTQSLTLWLVAVADQVTFTLQR
jgi:hypothetical protein